jgi:hypothetical protein
LVLVAGGLWINRHFLSPAPPTAGAVSAPGIAASAPPSAPTSSATTTQPSNSTDYVPEGFAEKFLSLHKTDPTPLQVDLLLRPYVGKRMRVSGILESVIIHGDGSLLVLVRPAGGASGYFVVAFLKKWTPQLGVLGAGSPVNVDMLIAEGEPPALTDGQLF